MRLKHCVYANACFLVVSFLFHHCFLVVSSLFPRSGTSKRKQCGNKRCFLICVSTFKAIYTHVRKMMTCVQQLWLTRVLFLLFHTVSDLMASFLVFCVSETKDSSQQLSLEDVYFYFLFLYKTPDLRVEQEYAFYECSEDLYFTLF